MINGLWPWVWISIHNSSASVAIMLHSVAIRLSRIIISTPPLRPLGLSFLKIVNPGGVISAEKMLLFRWDSVTITMSGFFSSMIASRWGSFSYKPSQFTFSTFSFSFDCRVGGICGPGLTASVGDDDAAIGCPISSSDSKVSSTLQKQVLIY